MTKQNEERITMYKVAQMLSEARGTHVREQQLYNYRKNGLIKTGEDGKVTVAEAEDFIAERVAKAQARDAKRQAKIEAELAGEEVPA